MQDIRAEAIKELPVSNAVSPMPNSAPLPAASEDSAILAMIERAARDPGIDIDKMERLFAMRERMLRMAAEQAYNAAMAAAQAEMIPVARNQKNTHTGSEYADLAALAEVVLPIAHKHGFGLSFSEFKSDQASHLGIVCEATHAAGFGKRYEFNIPVDLAGAQGKVNKTATQAYGSTFTYGRRYATLGVFNIAIKDKDGNSVNDMTPVSEEQATILMQLLQQNEADIPGFCRYFRVAAVAALPAKQFERAKIAIAKAASAKGKAQ